MIVKSRATARLPRNVASPSICIVRRSVQRRRAVARLLTFVVSGSVLRCRAVARLLTSIGGEARPGPHLSRLFCLTVGLHLCAAAIVAHPEISTTADDTTVVVNDAPEQDVIAV